MTTIVGKRHDLPDDSAVLEMGEYGKRLDLDEWWMRVPATGFGMGRLSLHEVVEHEDGTITVSPSILCTGHFGKQWHGYLERGIWSEV